MSFLTGRLASTEGAYFLQESKQAVGKLAQKLPPSSSPHKPPKSAHTSDSEEANSDVLHEVLRHSFPVAAFAPPADSSLSKASKWVLPLPPSSPSAVSPDAINPLKAFVSLPQVTFGPKRWQLPDADHSFLASTANDLRRDRSPHVNPEKLKAAADGLSQVGKAFAIATTVVFGGATLAFMLTSSKLQLHSIDDVKTKGKDLLLPRVEMVREQLIPLRIWAENISGKWSVEGLKDSKEKPIVVRELSKLFGRRTDY